MAPKETENITIEDIARIIIGKVITTKDKIVHRVSRDTETKIDMAIGEDTSINLE